jgi:hypothetical protein
MTADNDKGQEFTPEPPVPADPAALSAVVVRVLRREGPMTVAQLADRLIECGDMPDDQQYIRESQEWHQWWCHIYDAVDSKIKSGDVGVVYGSDGTDILYPAIVRPKFRDNHKGYRYGRDPYREGAANNGPSQGIAQDYEVEKPDASNVPGGEARE